MADEYELFLDKLNKRKGLDLHGYKRPQMERRINSLMRSLKCSSYDEYLDLMAKDSQHWRKFVDTLTINVSEFYRNPPQWEVLQNKVVPILLENSPTNLKIWSAGCSTGEEPYTVAMIFAMNFPHINVTILATDIDDEVMAKARNGIYSEKAVANLPKIYLTKYFRQDGTNFIINEEIKRKVRFQKHNLLKDGFDKHFDLILCRNVVIYFTEESKAELYKKFHWALKPKGILFTGSTEQIFQARDIGFQLVSSFFYQRS